MRKAIVLLALLVAVDSLSLEVVVPPKRGLARVLSSRMANVLRQARATFTLPDASQWVVHSVPAKREPTALGVTRFGRDGSARVFLVSDWLPKGTIPGGWAGQVYGVGMLNDGRVLVSAGWQNVRGSHNAIFVLSARADGTYHTDKVFEVMGGIGEIVGGPANTIVAITTYPAMRGGGPLMTHFNLEGTRIGTWGPFNHDHLSPVAAAQNAINARLHRISENRFALYDPSQESVYVFDARPGVGEFIWSGHNILFLGSDPSTAGMRVLGLESNGDANELLVVRTGLYRGRPGTLLTVFGRAYREEKQNEFLDVPWNLMLREYGAIHGVVSHGDMKFDTIGLRRD